MQDDARPTKRARNTEPESQFVDSTAEYSEPGSSRKTPGKKPPLSCAECRRLKLKCDRVFPCSSCKKRGCHLICPDGALTSGKGSRFILANTEQLHAKIIQMSDRIRQLEEALASLQAVCSDEHHPLLRQDLLDIKTTLELHGLHTEDQEAESKPLKKSNSPPSDLVQSPPRDSPERSERESNRPPDVPADIWELSEAFPVPWSINISMRQRIRDMLPPRERADYLCQQARDNALWQYNLDPSETFLPNIVRHVYTSPIQTLSPRRLSLLLMILAIGSRVDLNQAPDSPWPEIYHHLARAALCEMPLVQEPNYDQLHAMFYMAWYLLIFSEESSGLGYAWGIMGLTAKLAQALGLHRDTNRSKMIPEEEEGRRMLFWEILNLDARLALCLGRPPSLSMRHVDCKRPSYGIGEISHIPGDDVSYHQWKHGFFDNCLSPILEIGTAPRYTDIISLDRKVRDYRVPPSLDLFDPRSLYARRSRMMQQAIVATGREIALLQLHRPYFTQALSGLQAFSLHHQYAPSVLATFRSARQLIAAVETVYSLQPQLSARFLMFWFNAISGAVALCLLVSRAPSASIAPFALRELERVCRLFALIAEYSPKTRKALPLLAKLTDKSRRIYMQWLSDQAHSPQIPMNEEYGEPNSFENVHPILLQCLEETRTQLNSPIQEPSAFTSSEGMDEKSPSSQEMLDWYMGGDQGEFATLAVAQSHSSEELSGYRVPNHQRFNLDFGAFTGDSNNQSWMSWF